jgi:hypothetical protein
MKRRWIRVFKDERINGGKTWNLKFSHSVDGWTLIDEDKSKAKAVDRAYRRARKLKPCKVRIFSADGDLQVDYLVS